MRILSYLKNQYPQLSRHQLKKLIEDKQVFYNQRLAKIHDWVSSEDKVILNVSEIDQSLQANADVECQLVHETDDFIFVDKACSVHSVAHHYNETHTVANWLLSHNENLRDISLPLESGLLHRLDFETSGLMVAAKNQDAFAALRELFKDQAVHKEYQCLVSKEPPAVGIYEACVVSGKNQKVKLTEFDFLNQSRSVLTQILHKEKQGRGWLVKLKLITGFRHQIRAHLAFLGCPLVGDEIYGGLAFKRLMLHASLIQFTWKRQNLTVESLALPSFLKLIN